MFNPRTDFSLSEQDIQDIKQALDLIEAKMPFLVTLSTDDRKRLYKLGDKRFNFVRNSFSAAQSNPEILPSSFNVREFSRDYQLTLQLSELLLRLQQLQEQVDDTMTVVGSNVMAQSLTVYDYVKTASKSTPGLKSVAEQLGTAFKAMKAKNAKAESIANKDLN